MECIFQTPHLHTFYKKCPSCWMVYRYQEYKDGLHNLDDLHIFSLAVLQLITALVKVVKLFYSNFLPIISTGDSQYQNNGFNNGQVTILMRLRISCIFHSDMEFTDQLDKLRTVVVKPVYSPMRFVCQAHTSPGSFAILHS